jgi:uncharacterized protein YecE (DUF72 family)
MVKRVLVGTAGWNIPRGFGDRLACEGTRLERYARVFGGVEINSTFYRSHRPATFSRWAGSTAADFRFAVKMPRAITHEEQLQGSPAMLDQFLEETCGLGEKRGPILVQLPPSLAYSPACAGRFFEQLRARYAGAAVCEPRHATWFTAAADALLKRFEIARVAADPPRARQGSRPGGWPGLVYFRLHGAPRTYWSRYDISTIAALATALQQTDASEAWCIFDNTASGAAFENASELQSMMPSPQRG